MSHNRWRMDTTAVTHRTTKIVLNILTAATSMYVVPAHVANGRTWWSHVGRNVLYQRKTYKYIATAWTLNKLTWLNTCVLKNWNTILFEFYSGFSQFRSAYKYFIQHTGIPRIGSTCPSIPHLRSLCRYTDDRFYLWRTHRSSDDYDLSCTCMCVPCYVLITSAA